MSNAQLDIEAMRTRAKACIERATRPGLSEQARVLYRPELELARDVLALADWVEALGKALDAVAPGQRVYMISPEPLDSPPRPRPLHGPD